MSMHCILPNESIPLNTYHHYQWIYSTVFVLTASKTLLHSHLSNAVRPHPDTLSILRSFYTLSINLSLGLPTLLHVESNGFWRMWMTLEITGFVDFAHRSEFYITKTQRFGNWLCFHLQVREKRHSLVCLLGRAELDHWMETNPVSETLSTSYLEFRKAGQSAQIQCFWVSYTHLVHCADRL
jgi:hypothetical protein